MFYKVVTKETDGLFSAVILKSFRVEYTPNEWTKPSTGTDGIFIFETLEDAKLFHNNNHSYQEIWECEALNPKPCKYICNWYKRDHFIKFWKTKREMDIEQERFVDLIDELSYIDYAPNGSFLADEIKLLRKVS